MNVLQKTPSQGMILRYHHKPFLLTNLRQLKVPNCTARPQARSGISEGSSLATPGQLRSQIIQIANQLLSFAPSSPGNATREFTDPSIMLSEMLTQYGDLLRNRKLRSSHLHDILYLSARSVSQYQLQNSLLQNHSTFFASVIFQIHQQLGNFNNRQMAIIVWSLGEIGSQIGELKMGMEWSMDKFLADVVQWCAERMSKFTEREVVRIMVSFAKLKYSACDRIIPSLAEFCRKHKSRFKPEDLCTLSWSLSTLGLTEGKKVLEIIASTVKEKIRSITPRGLSHFLSACGSLEVKLLPIVVEPIMRKIEFNVRVLSPVDVAHVLWGLSQITYRPRFEFLEVVEAYFTDQISSFKPADVSLILKSLAVFSYAPETLLKVAKAYILDFHITFSFSQLCSIVWALSILDALESPFLKLALTRAEDLNNGPFWTEDGEKQLHDGLTEECLQQIFQGTLHLQLLKNEPTSKLFPDGLYEICKGSWTAHHLFATTNHVAYNILQNFEYLGYASESPFFETTSKLNLTCVKNDRGARIVIEVVIKENCFVNDEHGLQGPIRWRHRILKALGWPIMIIFEDDWMAMEFQEQAAYLADNIIPLLN